MNDDNNQDPYRFRIEEQWVGIAIVAVIILVVIATVVIIGCEDKASAQPIVHYEITLRDYFAGIALAGMIQPGHAEGIMQGKAILEGLVTTSYKTADAMIVARKELPTYERKQK